MPPPTRPMQFIAAGGARRAARAAEEFGTENGLAPARVAALKEAVAQVANNAVQHGAGGGLLSLWRDEDDHVVAEVWDRGHAADAEDGAVARHLRWRFGGGLWLVHRLADLVQVRSSQEGTFVRLHFSAAPEPLPVS